MIALNMAALAFMVPLGVSMAASVRVGNAIGRGQPEQSRLAARVALLAGFAFMSATSCIFLTLPDLLARLYTDGLGAIAVAAVLIPLAGVFGVFDGMQVISAGCLRGTGDTRFPMFVHLFGFWIVGIPLGWWLAFHRERGPAGLWWGLVAGLAITAVVLLARVRVRFAGVLERLAVEDEETDLPADTL
jgi:MATE family multidrug resistance protein